MRRLVLAGLSFLAAAGAASAQPVAQLEPLLNTLSGARLVGEDPIVATYFGVADILRLAAARDDATPGLGERLMSVSDRTVTAYFRNSEGWEAHTGVAREDVLAFLVAGSPPGTVTLWAMADGAAAALADFLPGQGFVPDPAYPDRILRNGEPFATDFAALDPANPWRGPIGQSSFVARMDDVILQAAAAEIIGVAAAPPPLAEAAPVAAILSALAGLPDTTTILQGMLFSPRLGAAMTPAAAGAPPVDDGAGVLLYQSGFIFDADVGGVAMLGITLAYTDCDLAAEQATAAADLWRDANTREGRTFQDLVPVEVTIVAGMAMDGLCAATALLAGPADGFANPAYSLAVSAIGRREFIPLRIRAL